MLTQDPLHDEGVQVRDALLAVGADVTFVSMSASHTLGWMFDKAASKRAWDTLVAYLRN